MIFNMIGGGGGGSGDAFAFIVATYPEGSTLTCSNTSTGKTLSAKDKSGRWVFVIPEAGEWEVKSVANDGSGDKDFASVLITEKGQRVTVDLAYGLWLFKEGVGVFTGYTAHLGTDTSGGSISASGLVWSTNDGVGNQVWFTPVVDTTNYSKLCVELKCGTRNGNSTNYKAIVGVGVNPPSGAAQPNDWVAKSADIWNTSRAIYEVPLIGVNGSYYVKLAGYATTGTIYNVWLEE